MGEYNDKKSEGALATTGALGAAGAGAAIGTMVVPGVGTAVGAIIGAIIGGTGVIIASESNKKK
jgi:phage tail tape-measure protein